jgi:hypothetical protein
MGPYSALPTPENDKRGLHIKGIYIYEYLYIYKYLYFRHLMI